MQSNDSCLGTVAFSEISFFFLYKFVKFREEALMA